jgi:uncharacterized protein
MSAPKLPSSVSMNAPASRPAEAIRWGRRWVVFAWVFLVGVYGVASAVGAWVLVRGRHWDIPPSANLLTENVRFTSADGTILAGWMIGQSHSERGVVLLHGHSGDRRTVLDRAALYQTQGWQVLSYDARGHGESPGQCTVGWLDRVDVVAAVEFLKKRGCREIIGHGISQGAATWLLAAEGLGPEVKGIIAESAYANLRETVRRRWPIKYGLPAWSGDPVFIPVAGALIGVKLADVSPEHAASQLRCPVFYLTGALDTRAPASDSERCARNTATAELWVVPGVGHTNLRNPDPVAYDARLHGFWRSQGWIP